MLLQGLRVIIISHRKCLCELLTYISGLDCQRVGLSCLRNASTETSIPIIFLLLNGL